MAATQATPVVLDAALATSLCADGLPEIFPELTNQLDPALRVVLRALSQVYDIRPKTIVREEKNKASDFHSVGTNLTFSVVTDPAGVPERLQQVLSSATVKLTTLTPDILMQLSQNKPLLDQVIVSVKPCPEDVTTGFHVVNNARFLIDFKELHLKRTEPFKGLSASDEVHYVALVTRLYEMLVATITDAPDGPKGQMINDLNARTVIRTRNLMEMFLLKVLLNYFVEKSA